MIPGVLLAYDASGTIISTLDALVVRDPDGNVLGLADFAAHEAAGGEHTAFWTTEGAKGSKVWPEWLGGRFFEFMVELEGPAGRKRIGALVHKASGHRRERAALETAIGARLAAAAGLPADIRDLVGGPNRPLELDENGRTRPWTPAPGNHLPLVVSAGPVNQQEGGPHPDMIQPRKLVAGGGRVVADSSHPEGEPV